LEEFKVNNNQIQHGDVLISKVNKLPDGAQKVSRKKGVIVVMDGEVTGHRHTIADKGAVMYEIKEDLYLKVTEPITITHDEHKPLPIPPGIYQIGKVREYDYYSEMERKVID
jgi:hypothetical protein